MSQLGVMLRESAERTETRPTTFLDLLRDQMDGLDCPMTRWRRRRRRARRTLKERLGFKGVGCCGPAWGLWPNAVAIADVENEEEGEEQEREEEEVRETQETGATRNGAGTGMVWSSSASSGSMNLAAALAAERQYRSSREGTPKSASLMRLMAETKDGRCDATSCDGNDSVCCVCMGRKKGAAFIPCGHTFCRICSREVWFHRGCCPLCNRPILEILDIY